MASKTLCLALLLLLSSWLNSSCHQQMAAVCEEFYNLPMERRVEVFKTFPVKKQLDLYRCEMLRRPPDLNMAYDIAEGGEKIIPTLLEELKAEKDVITRNGIIYIFRAMSGESYFCGRQDIVEQLKQAISQGKGSPFEKEMQQGLNEIEKNMRECK